MSLMPLTAGSAEVVLNTAGHGRNQMIIKMAHPKPCLRLISSAAAAVLTLVTIGSPASAQAVDAVESDITPKADARNNNKLHLHVHPQRPGTLGAPFSGAPLPNPSEGRYAIRNNRLTVPASRNAS